MSRWDEPRFGKARFAGSRFESRWGGESQGGRQSSLRAFTLFEAGALVPTTFGANNTELLIMDTSALAGGVPSFTVTHFRLTVQGTLDRIFIGLSVGGTEDTAALIQVLFGGNPGVIQANSSVAVSDLVAMPWNKTDDVNISFEFLAQDAPFINGTNGDLFGWYGVYGEADIEDKTGYSFNGQQITHVKKIEALG